VREHNHGDAVGLQHAPNLPKRLQQHRFEVLFRALAPAEAVGIRHHLLRFGRERRGEQVGMQMPHRALEPHIEKVA
jgi:hypothetical protein